MSTRRGVLYLIGAIIALIVFASAASPAHASSKNHHRIPRYEKSKEQCHGYKPCELDFYRRRRCNRLPRHSRAQVKCYVVYAARYYHQNVAKALDVAWRESRYDWNARNGRYRGTFQIGTTEWGDCPFGRWVLVRRVQIAGNQRRDVRPKYRPKHSVYSPKYNPLGAMWYWARGEYSRWSQTYNA